ncbi:Undecaprenyl phosphate N,N'-diacetylbacillosamine 1-phosphate transferase [Leuconostoc mesenteroides]|uniref:sugar transferase n=1 Tax=Leuconostoc mesenteroides TaxID=1245 RepID=UPI000D0C3486|nr:sugar transferase [Leuconostoc mesenteroides]SPE15525.1 Undecaprenyl phosphate N,N'-diacetylbacillosamine 1-phosphate transferase [Leuconostoc mesenteroides]SPI60530.1 Undecaprenyl phosphate N,N'-diacetylbacillosamine 1-phosphate transferase [Leuconostoc mesenteroides]
MYRRFLKRFFDLLLALFLFLILLLPLGIIALIVKLTSKGPILFIQERYGRNSIPFKLYKFRSMIDAAPEISNSNFSNIQNYITPFGMFIRKTSIDELPQLWNIIKGDMSFIGPRPLAITDDKVLRLRKINGADSVFPGISGLAQVNGRNNITDEEKALYDAKYAAKLSFHLDMLLIFETIVSVIGRKGVFNDNVFDSKKKG